MEMSYIVGIIAVFIVAGAASQFMQGWVFWQMIRFGKVAFQIWLLIVFIFVVRMLG